MHSFFLLPVLLFSETSFGCKVKTSTQTSKTNLTELVEALNTTQKVWLKWRSYAVEDVTCVYYAKISLKDNRYLFDECYNKGYQKKKLYMSAKLQQAAYGAEMLVKSRNAKGTRTKRYLLQYWNRDEKCGIFTQSDGCEQYVWGSLVRTKVTACDCAYERICDKRHHYKVYKFTCGT
uniref:Lipocalin n=1 Tax=Rhipicephalus zambeziensis TaxID=60191 RepID=A0A224YLI2_9ACAR